MNLELTPSDLLEHLQSLYLKQAQKSPTVASINPTKKKILIAYSGGLDSHVLLHLLSQISSDEFDLRAIYINHGLQVESLEWAEHCNRICQKLGISFTSVDLNLTIDTGDSIEEVARNARYEAIFNNLEADEILITAHHQNDQAETLLLQLFRGAGVQGLAAMPKVGETNLKGSIRFHFRPLLSYSRDALEKYAEKHELNFIEDPSNKNTAFDRNFLRQTIMPVLRERWLGIDKSISRSAAIQAETKTLLEEFAGQQLPTVLTTQTANYISAEDNQTALPPIDITALKKHSLSQQRLLLRYWITQQGFSSPSEKKLQHIFSDLIESAEDKQPLIVWKGVELRRYQQHLFIMSPLSLHDATQSIPWDSKNDLHIESLGQVLPLDLLTSNSKQVTVRFRQGGETIEIPKRGNIRLKNLFQELQIPPWIRSRLPLIYSNEKLVKIVGVEVLKVKNTPPYL